MKLDFNDGFLSLAEHSGATLDILFTGDLCPRDGAEERVVRGESDALLSDAAEELSGNDLSIVNLETPLTRNEEEIIKSGPNIKVAPECIELVKSGKWDVACCANNHIGDFGTSAVLDTLRLLKQSRIESTGAGRNLAEARKPLVVQRQGVKISILAFAENEFGIAGDDRPGANPLQPMRNISQIRKASSSSDITLVLIHGGNEYNPIPSPRVVDTYRAFAEAGAAAVIGGHTHCPQGLEVWKGVPIIYSISNFLFPPSGLHSGSANEFEGYNWWYGYMVRISFAENRAVNLRILPHCCAPKGEAVQMLKGQEKASFDEYFSHISEIITDFREVERYFDAWCMRRLPGTVELAGRSFYPADWNDFEAVKTLMSRRNQNTCEAHNELLTATLRILAERREESASEYLDKLEKLCTGEIPK